MYVNRDKKIREKGIKKKHRSHFQLENVDMERFR
jgi:hypothetical protein